MVRASAAFKKMESLRYTVHIDECCRSLEDSSEYPSDTRLVHLMRLRRIIEKMNQVYCSDELDLTLGVQGPLGMYVKQLEGELHEARTALPSRLQQDSKFLLSVILCKISSPD